MLPLSGRQARPLPRLTRLALLLALPAVASAADVDVCGDGSCDYRSLQAALDDVPADSTIHLPPGVYEVTAPLSKAVHLVGRDPQRTTISCGSSALEATLELNEGIGRVQVTDLTLERCPAGVSGTRAAQFSRNTELVLDNVLLDPLTDSSTTDAGGLIAGYLGTLRLINTRTLDDSTRRVSSSQDGGVLYATNSNIEVIGGTFSGNASGDGGCFALLDSNLTVVGATFDTCSGRRGGAVYLVGTNPTATTVSLQSVTVSTVEAVTTGGAFHIDDATVEARDVSVVNTTALRGSGFGLYGVEADLSGISVVDGVAHGLGDPLSQGAGIDQSDGSLRVRGATFTELLAGTGSGIHFASPGVLEVHDSTFIDLDANGRNVGARTGDGAAISASASEAGDVDLRGNRFDRISSTGYGGAVILAEQERISVVGNTFVDTTAAEGGGALKVRQSTFPVIRHNLFCQTEATAGQGGAIELYAAGTASAPVELNTFVNTRANDGTVIWTPAPADNATAAVAFHNNTIVQAETSGSEFLYHHGFDRGFQSNSNLYINPGVSAALSYSSIPFESSTRFDLFSNPTPIISGIAQQSVLQQDFSTQPAVTSGECTSYVPEPSALSWGSGDPGLRPTGWPYDWNRGAVQGTPADILDDYDEDGFSGDDDCGPYNPDQHPNGVEICGDGIDQDCDGSDLAPTTWYRDRDGDGAGVPSQQVTACDPPPGFAALDNDCSDGDDSVGGPTEWFRDEDGDGYGSLEPDDAMFACEAPEGFVARSGDCDDEPGSDGVRPDAAEVCDGVDNDCDGAIDDADDDVTDQVTVYADVDGDGFGDVDSPVTTCEVPADYVGDRTDCNDLEPSSNPGLSESCDGLDNDCDGVVDGPVTASTPGADDWFDDPDEDGFGSGEAQWLCGPQGDLAPVDGDCDESNSNANPGTPEWCDGIDTDCDGTPDNDALDAATFYRDEDSDGHGDTFTTEQACTAPPGFVPTDGDCNDQNRDVHPTAPEYCDDIDHNCDNDLHAGALDALDVWPDVDGDGFGAPLDAPVAKQCEEGSGYVFNNEDCDDNDASAYPVASPASPGTLTCDPAPLLRTVTVVSGGCSNTGGAGLGMAGWALLMLAMRRRR